VGRLTLIDPIVMAWSAVGWLAKGALGAAGTAASAVKAVLPYVFPFLF
jgi:hypothetical protein